MRPDYGTQSLDRRLFVRRGGRRANSVDALNLRSPFELSVDYRNYRDYHDYRGGFGFSRGSASSMGASVESDDIKRYKDVAL